MKRPYLRVLERVSEMPKTVNAAWFALVSLATVVALVLMNQSWAFEYPQETISNYVDTCHTSCMSTLVKEGLPSNHTGLNKWASQLCQEGCQCQVTEFQQFLEYQDFVDYDRALQAKTQKEHPHHQRIQTVMQQCGVDALKKNPLNSSPQKAMSLVY